MLKTFIIFVLAFVNYINCEFNLTVVHISDFHSHWFEYDENKHDCSKQESKEGKCFGGFPRLLTFVQNLKKKEENVLVLSSGEFFLGRSLHALHGWKLAHALLPRLDLDAMCLANHDFDSGVYELSAFLYAMKFPVLCANMWARNTSYLYSRVNKSVVIDVGGEKVGIVGYIHRHAMKKSRNAASVKFLPELPALQEEVQRLENEGVNKIIALGHAGYYTDLKIAREVKGVDIVIGGDSDIMLFDPGPDANETSKIGNIHGNYPRVHQHESEIENGKSLANRTLVLHIPQHGMFVGVLRATFDDQGKIIHESGEPVLLDSSIPQDEDTLEFLEYAKGVLETFSEHSRLPDQSELLGKTEKLLDGNPRNCRMRECSLGNFITDAMLYEFTFHYRAKSEHRYEFEHWGPIDALVFNSGSIKRSIEPGYITISDILKSISLGAFINRVYMSGKQLMDMMEHSVKHYDPLGITPPGAFLQIAGLRVEYDLSKPPGNRVRNLTIRCRDCEDNDIYFNVKPYKTYIIGMPTFLRNGRDGFYDFEEDYEEDMGQFDALLIVEYLRRMYEIEPKLDGRIKFYQPENIDFNLILGVPPLLFGEPVPEDNSRPHPDRDPKTERFSEASPEVVTNNENFKNEFVNNSSSSLSNLANITTTVSEKENNKITSDITSNKLPNMYADIINKIVSTLFENITNDRKINSELVNENTSKVHVNEDGQHNLSKIQQQSIVGSRLSDESFIVKRSFSVVEPEQKNKSAFQYFNDILTKNITKEGASETEMVSKREELLEILLNSSSENFPFSLEKLPNFFADVSKLFIDAGATNLKDRLIRSRSISESAESDTNKINNTESEEFMKFMENFSRNIFKDVFPAANLSNVESASARNYTSKEEDVKSFIKNYKEEEAVKAPPKIDFRNTVVRSIKSILGEDTLKEIFSFMTNFSRKANGLIADENQP